MHAARVLGDVAADRARDLRRRIRRVVEAVRRRRLGDREVAHARAARPPCARARRCARMRLNFASDSTMPSGSGSAPPDRLVPAPRATTGMRAAWHTLAGSRRPALRVSGSSDRRRPARGTTSGRRIRTASCPPARRAARLGTDRRELRAELPSSMAAGFEHGRRSGNGSRRAARRCAPVSVIDYFTKRRASPRRASTAGARVRGRPCARIGRTGVPVHPIRPGRRP